MYASQSFKTKKALKEAVARGERIAIFQPGPFGGREPRDGSVGLEGPNFEAHRWYAQVWLEDGVIVRVK